jgi:hypothetical protein
VIVLLPTVWAIGLSQQVDQLQGLTSRSQVHFSSPIGTDVIPTESAVLRFIRIHV